MKQRCGMVTVAPLTAPRMRRQTLLEKLVENLAGTIPTWSESFLPRSTALQQLKAMTGRDLGDDAELWRAWLADPESFEGFDDDTSPPEPLAPKVEGEENEPE